MTPALVYFAQFMTSLTCIPLPYHLKSNFRERGKLAKSTLDIYSPLASFDLLTCKKTHIHLQLLDLQKINFHVMGLGN